VLLILAVVLFVLKAFGVHVSNVDLGWLGLAVVAAALAIDRLPVRP
jgi:hypothetical protein